MTDRTDYELELIKAQISLTLKQSQTEIWKLLVAATAAGAALVVGTITVTKLLL